MGTTAKAALITAGIVVGLPVLGIGLPAALSQAAVGRINKNFQGLSLPDGYEPRSSQAILGALDTTGQGNRWVYTYSISPHAGLAAAQQSFQQTLTADGCSVAGTTATCPSQQIEVDAVFTPYQNDASHVGVSLTVREQPK